MNSTAKSFSIVTGFSIATRALSFIFKMWMSRALGAEIVGLYQMALSVIMMLLTITSGAPTVLSRKVAEAQGNIKKQNSLVCASLILGISVSGVICAILFACKSKLGFLFSNADCLPLFIIMLPTLVTSTLYASFRSWFWGRKNFIAFSSTELLDEIVKIVLSILFAGGIIGSVTGAIGIALAMTLSDALCVLVLAIIFFISGGRFAKPSGFVDITLRTIPLSATRIVTSVGASLTALIIPKMLVESGLSVAQATAEYGRVAGMALPLIMAPITFIGALSIVLIPDVAQLKRDGDLQTVRTKLSNAMTFSMLVACVFFVLYLPLGKNLGILLFKDEKAGMFVSYCSLILFPIALAQATTPMLNSLGKERNTFLHTLIGALAMLPCIFFLPKFLGVYSMAVASGVCFLIIAILNFITLKREVGMFLDGKKLSKMMFFSIPLAIIGLFSARLLGAVAGSFTTLIVMAVFLLFFIFVFISAFDIIDICGYLKMLRPSTLSLKRSQKSRKPEKQRSKRSTRKLSTRKTARGAQYKPSRHISTTHKSAKGKITNRKSSTDKRTKCEITPCDSQTINNNTTLSQQH